MVSMVAPRVKEGKTTPRHLVSTHAARVNPESHSGWQGYCNTRSPNEGRHSSPAAPRTSWPLLHLARLEQIARPTSEHPTELAKRLERRVLTRAFEPVQCGAAEHKPLRHLNLRQRRGVSYPSQP